MDVTGHITGRELMLMTLFAITALSLIGLIARWFKH